MIVCIIQEIFQTNRQKLDNHVSLVSANGSNCNISSAEKSDLGNMLTAKMENPLHKFGGIAQGLGDKDVINCQDATYPTSAKLPLVEKIPSYTTWIFLDRYVAVKFFLLLSVLRKIIFLSSISLVKNTPMHNLYLRHDTSTKMSILIPNCTIQLHFTQIFSGAVHVASSCPIYSSNFEISDKFLRYSTLQ